MHPLPLCMWPPHLLGELCRLHLPDPNSIIEADAQHTPATPRLPIGTLAAFEVLP
mgnify:CR=1 FL=1